MDTIDKDGRTALMRASLLGDAKEAARLLANGARVNIQNMAGKTALMRAIAHGHKEVVALLL